MVEEILPIIGAYLLGSIPFGYWLVRLVKGIDVRTQGSGNIGMTNVWRVAGAGWGITTLAMDIAKGALAVWLGGHFDPTDDRTSVLCGLAALLGNVFSLFLKFKGGKGIGVSVGVFYSLLPIPSLLGTTVFVAALALTRMISVGSLLGVTTMAVLSLLIHKLTWASGLAGLAAGIIWWTHRQNIQRILNGTENKIGRKKA